MPSDKSTSPAQAPPALWHDSKRARKAVLTIRDRLSSLLTNTKSHGAEPPSYPHSVFSATCFAELPQRDFTDLTRLLKDLNPRLKSLCKQLEKVAQLVMRLHPVPIAGRS